MHASSPELSALLADLNEPQRRAVAHRDGPLLVIAGPGSGKTRVITRRAAYLVQTGVPSYNILAITFTNKAADEMRRRIAALGVARGMWVYTFHALGVRLLREFGALGRVQPGFTIYDEDDSLRVAREALEAARVPEYVLKPETARELISDAKNRLLTPDDVRSAPPARGGPALADVYAHYERLLEQRNAVDFDDLLMRVARVLQDHPTVAERLNVRFRYVLIDEYQDTNHAQYLIARYLSQHHGNICATGDPDQSIYGWRGADIRNILEFERDYPQAVVVRLEQNYRSTGRILSVADKLIAANYRRRAKTLWTERGPGEPVRVWRFGEGLQEAERIAASIKELRAAGRPYSDVAIFYRINALSRGLEEALRHHAVPYRVARGVAFYNRAEIRDVVAYLRVLLNPADDVALLRIINRPARGIGKTTVERLQTRANETGASVRDLLRRPDDVPGLAGAAARRVRAFSDLLDALAGRLQGAVPDVVSDVLRLSGLEEDLRREREAGGEDRLANVQELVTAAVRYADEADAPALDEFVGRISLASDQDRVDEQAGVVMLMTLHAAKGLEFPIVYVVGLEQGLLPHERGLRDREALEEERRLCFVGVTRAREQLVLTHAAERLVRGQRSVRATSQFLRELDDGTLTWKDFQPPPFARPGVLPSGPRGIGLDEGFEPLVDDLPAEEAARLAPRRRWSGPARDRGGGLHYLPDESEPGQRPETEPERRQVAPEDESPADSRDRRPHSFAPTHDPVAIHPAFANWQAGMRVRHARYGEGELLWIRPGAGNTRAGVRFTAYGEKTMILEFAGLELL